jgi:dTDP-4-amino-4,6-dideoxygalactose transaminase
MFPMPVPFFDLNRQNIALRFALDQAVAAVITSGKFILGEAVAEFEREAAAYCGTAHAIGVASGTDALHLALKAVGVKAGDEVITTPFTFVATADAIAYCDATPVFVDIEPNTFNIDPAKIEEHITPKTKAILPVHLYGQSCAMDKIMALAKKHNFSVNGLKKILRNFTYIGKVKFDGQIHQGKHQAIISSMLFNKVQDKLDKIKKIKKEK